MKRASALRPPFEVQSLAWDVFRDSAIATLGFLVLVCLIFL